MPNIRYRRALIVLISLLSLPFMSYGKNLTLVYSGNVDGELEPCGCSAEGDFGGIRRQVTAIDALRKRHPNLALISTGGWIGGFSAHEKLTGDFILKAVAAIGYDAVGVQWSDLSYGTEFITPHSISWVATNWRSREFLPVKRFRRNDQDMAFFSWLDPEQSPFKHLADRQEDSNVTKMVEALRAAKRDKVLTLVSTTLPLPEAQRLLPMELIDILFVRAAYEKFAVPQRQGKTVVLQPGSRGMRLGQLDFSLAADGSIGEFQHQVIDLPKTVADSPRMEDWYTDYNERVKAAFVEETKLRKAQASGDSEYMGEQVCQACHVEQYSIWQQSRHSQALESLRRVNKTFDPDCIACHTVGFRAPGGYIDDEVTAHLTNVQCESCHGPGRAHVASNGATKISVKSAAKGQVCAQCHNQKHSPAFDFERYWPKIAHGRSVSIKK